MTWNDNWIMFKVGNLTDDLRTRGVGDTRPYMSKQSLSLVSGSEIMSDSETIEGRKEKAHRNFVVCLCHFNLSLSGFELYSLSAFMSLGILAARVRIGWLGSPFPHLSL